MYIYSAAAANIQRHTNVSEYIVFFLIFIEHIGISLGIQHYLSSFVSARQLKPILSLWSTSFYSVNLDFVCVCEITVGVQIFIKAPLQCFSSCSSS